MSSLNDSLSPLPLVSPAPRRRRISPVWPVLLIAAAIISIGITKGEVHFNGDEMRHAFTGVFFRDLMVDAPLADPIRYAFEYYAKYPALGVPHWPPFFYFVEGIFFLIFGISVFTSRLAILAFALMGIYFWYRIAERQGPTHRAVLSALIFPLLPYILLYERVTMLEIPMIALCLGTLYFWIRFLETERSIHVWAVALFLAAALLTSQKAAFVVFFIILHFLMERRFRLLLRWQVWAAGAASAAVVLPWYFLTIRTVVLSMQRVSGPNMNYVSTSDHWLYYLYHLHRQVGPEIVILGGAGVLWALFFAARQYRFLLLWFFSTYLFFSLIREKDLRHTMIWIPPLVYFSLLAIEALFAHRRWALLASGGFAVYFAVGALQFDRPRMGGVEEVARFVTSQPDADLVYYQGFLNGDFIFHVRKFDPQKKHFVAREKQVVATRIVHRFGTLQVIETPEQVLDLFRTWGIRYAVIQDRDTVPGLEPVHQALASGSFQRIRDFTLWSNNSELNGRQIFVYRYLGPIERHKGPVVIPMLTLREHIRADLNRLAGRPWPN